MATLSELVKGVQVISVSGDVNRKIEGVAFDSRKAGPGYLFVAVKGTKTDGHEYIKPAVESGAVAIVCEKLPSGAGPSVIWITVADSAEALGMICSNFYGNPSAHLHLVGVTEDDRGEGGICRDLYHGKVGLGVRTDDLGNELLPVGEDDLEMGAAAHDMLIGDDISGAINHEAGAAPRLDRLAASEPVVELLLVDDRHHRWHDA